MRDHPCLSAVALLALIAVPAVASAQNVLETPQPSQKARVEQRVGITDFSIDYSSPGVKGRKIWGEVVPYDKVWRAGANAPTKLTASRDFTFGGAKVKAGSYTIFVTPTKAQWAVALNSDLAANQGNHDAKKDVARVTVAPAALPAVRERLVYVFDNNQEASVSLDLEWEKVRIRVPITVDTKAQVNAVIEKATAAAWRPHFEAANHLFDTEVDRALALVDKSIAIQSTWRNEWLRAELLGKKGKKAEAIAAATRAQQLGKGDEFYERFQKEEIAKAIAGWK